MASEQHSDLASAKEVESLERQNREASVQGNPAFFDALSVDNFIAIDPQGNLSEKVNVLQSRKRSEMKYDSIDVDNENIRVYGSAAIVTGTANVKGRHQGNDSSGRYRYTRVYVKVQGKWRIASSQSTRIVS